MKLISKKKSEMETMSNRITKKIGDIVVNFNISCEEWLTIFDSFETIALLLGYRIRSNIQPIMKYDHVLVIDVWYEGNDSGASDFFITIKLDERDRLLEIEVDVDVGLACLNFYRGKDAIMAFEAALDQIK